MREVIPEFKFCTPCGHIHAQQDFNRRNDEGVVRLQAYCKGCKNKNVEHPKPLAQEYVDKLITTDIQLVRQLFNAEYPNNVYKRGWRVMAERLLAKGGYKLTAEAAMVMKLGHKIKE